MTKFFDILGFVAQLKTIEHDIHELGPKILERACLLVMAEAKKRIGKNHRDWPPLAAATIADRVRQGFAPNQPLLRSGEMRDSLQYTIASDGMSASVGSDDPVAVFQELGTSRIPPRSWLVAGAQNAEERIYKMAARAVVRALEGHGTNSLEFEELIHLLKHVAESVKDNLIDPYLPKDDEGNEK